MSMKRGDPARTAGARPLGGRFWGISGLTAPYCRAGPVLWPAAPQNLGVLGSTVLFGLGCGVWGKTGGCPWPPSQTGWRWVGHGAAGGEERAGRGGGAPSPMAPGPRLAAMSPVAACNGEAKPRSFASSCAGEPWCSRTLFLHPPGTNMQSQLCPGGSGSPPPPRAPQTCSRVFGAGRADAALGVEWGRDRLVLALWAETGHSSVHGPAQGAPPQPHCPATWPQPIPTHQHSLPANPTLPPVPPFLSPLPPALVLPPPTIIKQHPGLTNPGPSPGASPQPTTCRHLSLL